MKIIMFNEQYGLQQAVLDRTKPLTRRFVKCPKKFRGVENLELEFHKRRGKDFYYDCVVLDDNGHELGQLPLPYEVGEVVAIAQRYKDAGIEPSTIVKMIDEGQNMFTPVPAIESPGWKNKMYVRADLMPHHIQITDLWFEHLQDISDEDCMKEGVFLDTTAPKCYQPFYTFTGSMDDRCPVGYRTPRRAFAALIDRLSGRGTWESNPWVIVYTFELVD